MCGIAGIWQIDGSPPGDVQMRAMLDAQRHRGPDGEGIWRAEDTSIALGHRRLAIIDVSNGGAQPMKSADDRFVITFNGEIYNFVELRQELESFGFTFVSGSDTEVLLAAYEHWGRNCLTRLNGMFAFAVYDTVEKTLFCARDRLGVKPFVYSWNGSRFAFASEQKALLAARCITSDINHDAVYEYAARGYTTDGRSFYADVQILQPGHAAEVSPGKPPVTWQWWKPDLSVDTTRLSAQERSEQIAHLVDDAVRLRLRSDVPVGAHLSGGLDSSIVVASAARCGANESGFATFTGAFPEYPDSDERAWSRDVANMYQIKAHEIDITVEMLAHNFQRMIWHMDEPIAGEGVLPQLLVCDLAASAGFKVVLGGQGGDELFGGYLRHRALHWKRLLKSGSPGERSVAALELIRLAIREARRVRRTSTFLPDDGFNPEFLRKVSPEVRAAARQSRLSFVDERELMQWDLFNYLPALLHVEDRTSMAASIESRTPFLDYRLVEYALRIPTNEIFSTGYAKPLLRNATRSWIPESVANRKDKKGFPTPLDQWMNHTALRHTVERLTECTDVNTRIFAADYLNGRRRLTLRELWLVMSINGWISAIESGSMSQQEPFDSERIKRIA